MVRCIAITNQLIWINFDSFEYKNCSNLAKFGEFCGVHCPQKTTCLGITKCGIQCKKSPKFGKYCYLHLQLDHPVQDGEQLRLYSPDVGWPVMRTVSNLVKSFKNGRELDIYMTEISNRYDTGCHDIVKYFWSQPDDNRCTMILLELIFRNYYIDYSTPHWQGVINILHNKISPFGFLNKYRILNKSH